MPDTMVGASSLETWPLLLRHSFCLGRCHLTSAVIDVIGGPVDGALGPTWRSQERPHLDGDSWVGLPCVLSQSAAIHSCREQKINASVALGNMTFFSYMRKCLDLYKGILTKYYKTCISFLEYTVR